MSIPNLPREVLVAGRHDKRMYEAKVAHVDSAFKDIKRTQMNDTSRAMASEKMKRTGVLKYYRNAETPVLGHQPIECIMMTMPPGRCVFNMDPPPAAEPTVWAGGRGTGIFV